MSRTKAITGALFGIALLSGCSGGEPELAGIWVPDDGSGSKVVQDDGRCSGMYYNAGTTLDIGGPMTCTRGETQADGTFSLMVEQPPNSRTYTATFSDDDTLVLSDSGGVVVTLSRG